MARLRLCILPTMLVLVAACLGGPAPTPGRSVPSMPTATDTAREPSPSPQPATADEVFRRVAPSVAFIATDVGTGSAFVLDDRRIVTNAHVVRPYRAVRVVLSDGTEIDAVPVVGWDLRADLAVLELSIARDRPTLEASDAAPRTGARVYLVGYPLADPNSPAATITEGIISGSTIEWLDGLTYHQTDAAIEDGQSGGVLVDATGRFLGVTGGSRGRFAVALDGADALARIEGLLEGDDVDGIGDRVLPDPDPNADTTIDVTIRHRADAHTWVLAARQGDPAAKVSVTSDRPVGLYALAAAGRLGSAAGPPGTKLSLDVKFDAPGPFLVKLESNLGRPVRATLRSTVGLTPFDDPDDGRPIARGRPWTGAADYAGDIDWYVLSLAAGETVRIRASASALDPALFIDRLGDEQALARGHDAGGPLGVDDEIEFKAPSAGEYLVVVTDPGFSGAGAYRLEIQPG
jgi:hypothetical protein